MGGGNAVAVMVLLNLRGLSPRGRGKLRLLRRDGGKAGSIPAWAGETHPARPVPVSGWVYPRVGGGNGIFQSPAMMIGGLSPRGRGKHGGVKTPALDIGSIPAWAGETETPLEVKNWLVVYPRVGGGNRACRRGRRSTGGLSPRGRGKRVQGPPGLQGGRSIPAWAGETALSTPPE